MPFPFFPTIRRSAAGMMLLVSTAFGADAPAQPLASPRPTVQIGRVERLAQFPSRHVAARDIDVWLPNGYSPSRQYQVLYMHDGQMLFDANTTWNKQAWNVQVSLSKLIDTGEVPDTIVVAVPNAGTHRYSEYFPEKYLAGVSTEQRREYVDRAQHGKTLADAYLRFLVEELKPAIDQRFSTRPEAASTFVMGSSMGGMISVYALCEYPQVFGGAAALSTHWVGKPSSWGPPAKIQNTAFPMAAFAYLRQHLPAPQTHRLYIDRGTMGLDAIYAPHQAFVDEIVREAGYGAGNLQTRVFEGTGHSEADWSARLDVPLRFLLARR